ncbi:phage baseplate assembly protein V [Acinetobacter baumannii]|uniref:phage baseplate assembly protein V n=1 Tax=Acinetobacter baumannii TaxID=470 RepID=UPI0020A1C86A|nr:phage baseplate assembly protein V [Acinetobacter baumannii]MCO9029595.1 phage baseplate assembly protein V [Acinetobacter baumannii]
MNISEIIRRLENIVRFGSIDTVDLEKALCTVNLGDIKTAQLNWLNIRAGTDSSWDPPTPGERCIVFSPSGELAQGVVLFGIYSEDNPAPAQSENIKLRKFSDGTVIQYDISSHALKATLINGGSVEITASGGFTFNGNTKINGSLSTTENITTDADVIAGNISLIKDKTPGIKAGGDTSGAPVP